MSGHSVRNKENVGVSKPNQPFQYTSETLLRLAREGDLSNLHDALSCVKIDAAMLHKIFIECTVTMSRMSRDFDTARAQFLAELQK